MKIKFKVTQCTVIKIFVPKDDQDYQFTSLKYYFDLISKSFITLFLKILKPEIYIQN